MRFPFLPFFLILVSFPKGSGFYSQTRSTDCMSNPEDVDEINEYLQARRKKQDLGELPKPDATPGFIKKLGTAIFGAPKVNKVPLNSAQPTYASPKAQTAVRKQLAEIMQEKGRTTTPAPPSVSSARSLSNIPSPSSIASAPVARYPQSEVWKNNTPKPTLPVSQPPAPTVSNPIPTNSTTPIKVSAYISTPTSRLIPSTPTIPLRETPRYMPPWVARDQKTNPLAPRVNPPVLVREKENSSTSTPVTMSSARMPYSASTTPPQPMKEMILPTISREDAPTPEEERMHEMRRNSLQSGEIKVDGLSPSVVSKPIEPLPVADPVHEFDSEMTEEEALEKLPFEDVDGLSADDLAYLERKEKEHRAAQDQQESDHVSPDALKLQLDRQSSHVEARVTSSSPDTSSPVLPSNDQNSGNDEKKKILERLRHMMATESPPASEN